MVNLIKKHIISEMETLNEKKRKKRKKKRIKFYHPSVGFGGYGFLGDNNFYSGDMGDGGGVSEEYNEEIVKRYVDSPYVVKIMNHFHLTKDDIIGAGRNGIALNYQDDKILKITNKISEYTAAKKIQHLNLKHYVKMSLVKGVKFENETDRPYYYIFIMEKLKILNKHEIEVVDHCRWLFNRNYNYDAGKREIERQPSYHFEPISLSEQLKIWDQYFEAATELSKITADLKGENCGYSKEGVLTFFDGWDVNPEELDGETIIIESTEDDLIRKYNDMYPLAGSTLNGLEVKDSIPNTNSISASLNDYYVLKGVRAISISEFNASPKDLFYATSDFDRVDNLVKIIGENEWISPLIVVVDKEGLYVLEGAHRLAALFLLGVKEIPALVVLDLESLDGEILTESNSPSNDKLKTAKTIARKSETIQDFFNFNWDELLFGFNSGDIVTLPLKDIKIKWKDDYENAKYRFSRPIIQKIGHPFDNKPLNKLPPVSVYLTDEGYILNNGHHRYYYAELLGKSQIQAEVEIHINPFLYMGIEDPQKFFYENNS